MIFIKSIGNNNIFTPQSSCTTCGCGTCSSNASKSASSSSGQSVSQTKNGFCGSKG